MKRYLLVLAIALVACGRADFPFWTPRGALARREAPRESPPPPPPPLPDYSYTTVPGPIAFILSDPQATVDLLVLGDQPKNGRFHGWPVTRRQRLDDEARDRIAAFLTSRITYGHMNGFCSAPGLGLHLQSKRNGTLDLRVDPVEARMQILDRGRITEFALSMAGVRVFEAVREQYAGNNGCG